MIPPGFDAIISEIIEDKEILKGDKVITRITIRLNDNSILSVYEARRKNEFRYGYHWRKDNDELIDRWDNAPHHTLTASFPFHQNTGSEDNIQPAEEMTLEKVLAHISFISLKNI